MNRPMIKVKTGFVDIIIELVGLLSLILLVALPVFYYDIIPETIPRHYNMSGDADSNSSKVLLWGLPLIGMVLHIGIRWITKFPHLLNYPLVITAENADYQYKNSARMLRVLNTFITGILCYITYGTIEIALGNWNSLGKGFLSLSIITCLGIIGYFQLKSVKNK